MKTHNLIQGTPQWLAYRAQNFNASDAPAMLGESAYKTRTQLLHEMHTGLSPEVDTATQARFDDGHRFEALARPLAEEIIGMELYPVTGSEGRLSASFDGLSMCETTAFEHKTLNAELRAAMPDGWIDTPVLDRTFPAMYRIQMEQQLMVSGAQRCLFMASKWDGEELVEERHAWYHPDQELRSAILQGWAQFAIDLENYSPEAAEAKPIGRTPETLPALHIEVTGMVTASNLAEYKAHALAVFAGINRELVTDSDFANAESTVKWCSDIETRLAAAKQHALSQTASIDDLFKTIEDISAEARATRLELDRLVKSRKDSIRAEIVADGRNAMADHIAALNTRIGRQLMPAIAFDFAGAIKGKRTLDSMRDAVATELARAKINANEWADKITLNLRAINDQVDFGFLFSDVATLVLKEPEFVAMVINNRIAEHHAKEAARVEAQRLQIEASERAKAQAEERARADAEIATATAQARAEAQRQAAADAEAKRASDEATAKAREQDYMAKIDASRMRHNASGQPPKAPVCTILQTENDVATASPLSPPTMRLGQICERLGFTLTADFVASLGFHPVATDKAAKLYQESDFQNICSALVRHVQAVAQGVEA